MALIQAVSCCIHTLNFTHEKSLCVNSKSKFRNQSQINSFVLGLKTNDDSKNSARMKSLVVYASEGGAEVETTVVVEKPKLRQFQVFSGSPAPFGATARDGGVNFAVYSGSAAAATLCLMSFSDLFEKRLSEQISLDPLTNRTGDIWHVFLKGDFRDMLYGYKFDGKFSPEEGHYYDSSQILIDPYAKAVLSRGNFGVLGPDDDCWPQMACMVPFANTEFDWEGDLPLKLPQRDLVIYEMHVRGFTRHDSSRTEFPGTYLGVVEKLDHLKVNV
ncbi:Iron-sulfur assembly protein 1 [Sarracenia purpurea var. burkii]